MKGTKGPNQLLYDFGVANAENDKEVQQKIEEIDKTFHLVMILENFQVSKVIFRAFQTLFLHFRSH